MPRRWERRPGPNGQALQTDVLMGLSGHPLGAKPGPALLDEEHHEEAHWHRLQHQGYTSENTSLPSRYRAARLLYSARPPALLCSPPTRLTWDAGIAAPPDIAPLSAHLLSL